MKHKTLPDDPARANMNAFRRAYRAGHEKFIEKATANTAFYHGDQWDKNDLKLLERQRRPAKTLNLTLSTINAVLGEYDNRRADFRAVPSGAGATPELAAVVTKVFKHIVHATDYDDYEAEVLLDGLLTGRGYFDVRITNDTNVDGEIVVSALDPRNVIPDPSATSYDPADWNEVIVTRWMSLDDIAVFYGEEARDRVKDRLSSGLFAFDPTNIQLDTAHASFGELSELLAAGAYDDLADKLDRGIVRHVRVIERQYKRTGVFFEMVDPQTGEVFPLETENRKEAAAEAEQRGYFLRKSFRQRVRWTVSCDSVTLHDDWSPYRSFTIVPFFCYYTRGTTTGMVDNLRSPQESVNKAASQFLHVINTTANSGWLVPKGSLSNMTIDDLETRGAETGIVLEYNASIGAPTKINPNHVPTGLDAVYRMMVVAIREISGVNNALLGLESAEVSGVALENKQLRASVVLQPVFKNIRRTRKLVGRKFLELLQDFYTQPRILPLVDETKPVAAQEQVEINVWDEASQQFINDLTIGEYKIVVADMPARDVYEDSTFAQMVQLREIGVPIPAYHLAEASTLPNKYELAEELKQIEGAAAPSELEMKMQELQLMLEQAQVREKMAKAESLLAQAQLFAAKAQSEAVRPDMEEKKLEADLEKHYAELSVRERTMRQRELGKIVQTMATTDKGE